jgi:tetratricopeptide (TPR) repeat protein
MGETYFKLGNADSAQFAYDRAILTDSLSANAYMMYGQLLEELGRLDEALKHSKQALALEPTKTNYQFAVGSQLFQLGHLEEAVPHLKRAADGRLLHYPAQFNLAQTLARLGHEKESQHYFARADSSRELMDQITNTQSIAAKNPNSAKDWAVLGELFRKAGERDRAVQAFNRAMALDPENIRVRNNVGEMLLAEGDVREAARIFQSILRTDEAQPDVWKNLGLAFAVAGLCDDARQALQIALDYKPDNATYKKLLAGICISDAG